MKVFIAWSGERSRLVAEALHSWLKDVIQILEPWMSDKDIDKGANWRSEISVQLSDAKFGIICLTSDNLESTWLHFESGALAHAVDDPHVCPYLFDLRGSDVRDPFSQFQLTNANKTDTFELVKTINRTLLPEEQLTETFLDRNFHRCWPELENRFTKIRETPSTTPPKRSADELLEEILWLTRTLTANARPKTEEEKKRWLAEALHEMVPNLPVPYFMKILGETFQERLRAMQAALNQFVVKKDSAEPEDQETA